MALCERIRSVRLMHAKWRHQLQALSGWCLSSLETSQSARAVRVHLVSSYHSEFFTSRPLHLSAYRMI